MFGDNYKSPDANSGMSRKNRLVSALSQMQSKSHQLLQLENAGWEALNLVSLGKKVPLVSSLGKDTAQVSVTEDLKTLEGSEGPGRRERKVSMAAPRQDA